MNYYPFHIGDYIAHTAHLDPIEDCAYRRLLDAYYLNEGPLPADAADVARKIRMKANAADVERVLNEFFTLTDDGWLHARCNDEISKMKEKQSKAKASAEASVRARQAKAGANVTEKKSDEEADGERTLNERSTDAELPTPTPTPNKEEAKASLSTSSPDKPMDELFADEGKAKAAGVPSCPIDALLDAYEELLPTLPAPRRSLFKAGKRAAPMRQRWAWVLTATHERGPRAGQRLATNAAEGVEWFRKYFEHVAKSDFLTGRDGKWTGCNIGFLMQLEKFSKVLEGAYHQAEVPHA